MRPACIAPINATYVSGSLPPTTATGPSQPRASSPLAIRRARETSAAKVTSPDVEWNATAPGARAATSASAATSVVPARRARSSSARSVDEVVGIDLEVPDVEAVGAPVGDDVADGPPELGITGQPSAPAAAVHAHDCVRDHRTSGMM